jgi:hypothetical protein
MTIVVRRKEVYSWTNLMKKVVRDAVSNHLRKEHYDTIQCVNIDQANEASDVMNGTEGSNFLEHYESTDEIRPEDLIYLGQLLCLCRDRLRSLYSEVYHLSHYLVLRMAMHAVVNGSPHPMLELLPRQHQSRYQFYVCRLRGILAPVLNQQYLKVNL